MGRPRKHQPESAQADEHKIDTSEGGLITSSHPNEMKSTEDEDFNIPEEMYAEPTVDSNISADPNATPASAMLAIGRLYIDAGIISSALSKHLRNVAGEPELFSFLQSMQNAIGDFRHMVEQVESAVSEELLSAIESAVA